MADKTTKTQRNWYDNWSWKKLIRFLSDGNSETQLQVARQLWRLQAGSFQQLRDAIAHPEHLAQLSRLPSKSGKFLLENCRKLLIPGRTLAENRK